MTVEELKKELEFYEDDQEIVFEINDDFVPESVTEDRCGNRRVHIDEKVKPTFISDVLGNMWIELGVLE